MPTQIYSKTSPDPVLCEQLLFDALRARTDAFMADEQALTREMKAQKIKNAKGSARSEKKKQVKKDTSSFKKQMEIHQRKGAHLKAQLDNVLVFEEEAFGHGNELIISLSEMTKTPEISSFIATYGSNAYTRLSEDFLFQDRSDDLSRRIEAFLT